MKGLRGSVCYLGKWKQSRYTSRVCIPLCCCDLSSAAFSICLGDKRVRHWLPVWTACAATAELLLWPCRHASTAKQEVKTLFVIPDVRLNFQTILHIRINTPTPDPLSDRPPSAKNMAKAVHGYRTWIKDLAAVHGTACYCRVLTIVNICVRVFSLHRQ